MRLKRIWYGLMALFMTTGSLSAAVVQVTPSNMQGWTANTDLTASVSFEIGPAVPPLGIGSAHQTGIQWAYDHGYERLVTMDCDFTHEPSHIPELLDKVEEGCDVAVGSRYLQQDGLKGWNAYRKLLTHLGHVTTRLLLGMSYDATNAYRCYRFRGNLRSDWSETTTGCET